MTGGKVSPVSSNHIFGSLWFDGPPPEVLRAKAKMFQRLAKPSRDAITHPPPVILPEGSGLAAPKSLGVKLRALRQQYTKKPVV